MYVSAESRSCYRETRLKSDLFNKAFNTTYQPTGDQQKDAIAQIDIMQNRAVQANLAYQSSLDAETLMKQLGQINDELGALLDSLENHTPVIRKKASDLSALMMLFSQQAGQP
ncbi:hypothetical protein MZI62_19435 [Escherichia coli]|nr:hypothetical protein [Escherichia coli]